MVKQKEGEWSVFGKMSVERYSFYETIDSVGVSCIWIAILRSRSRMIEDQVYKQIINITDPVHLFQPHVSLISLLVTALESGEVVANPPSKVIDEIKV